MSEKKEDLLWAMLPDDLEEFFDVEDFKQSEAAFLIILKEKNILPTELPGEYSGKKVINTVTQSTTIDYFPIKGRKTIITLKRRLWKFEGVEKMLKRDIEICAEGTKLEKEFAVFLKGFNRD